MKNNVDPQHFAFIDALRGWAFLNVFFFHAVTVINNKIPVKPMLYEASYAPQLFYVVSSFTLLLSLDYREQREKNLCTNFFLRRLFRIAPLYWFVLAIMLAWGYHHEGSHYANAYQTVTSILFLHGWHPTTIESIVGGGWSMAVEANSYLFLPFIFYYIRTIKAGLALFATSLLLLFVANGVGKTLLASFVPGERMVSVDSFLYYWLPNQLPVFVIGVVLYLFFKRGFADKAQTDRRALAALVLSVGSLSVEFCFVLFNLLEANKYSHILHGICFAVLSYGLALRPWKLFVNFFTLYCGKISYSLYLVHFLVLGLLYPWVITKAGWVDTISYSIGYSLLAMAVVLGVTIGICTVTYHLIEVPGQNLGRYLIKKLNKANR